MAPARSREPTGGRMPLHIALYWISFIVFSLIVLSPIIRILKRAGYSEWWSLLAFVPVVNLMGLWWFAYARWPKLAPLHPTAPGA
jgi:uncharacterized membrane protein YhaH (DUF805 family)